MRVLLFGDYSKVHHTLSQGLRALGVEAVVASHGDGWKNYDRDINITMANMPQTASMLLKFIFSKKFKGYDVVQFINYAPLLTTQKWYWVIDRIVDLFKHNNEKVFLGAFGDDYYWVKASREGYFEYSFLEMYDTGKITTIDYHSIQTLLGNATEKAEKLNKSFAEKSNGIIAGLYDYWYPYSLTPFSDKLDFIPFPVNTKEISFIPNGLKNGKISFLLGVQKGREAWKGADILHPVLEEFKAKYPDDIELIYVENCPYNQYQQIMDTCHVVVDQAYSMGQGMNALTAMAKGKVVLSGGEACHYHLVGEKENHPVVNVRPDKAQVREQLEKLLDNRNQLEDWGYRNRKYIEDHHDYVLVAERYLTAWNKR